MQKQEDYRILLGSLSLLTREEDIRISFTSIKKAMTENALFALTTLKPIYDHREIKNWTEKMRYPYDGNQIICHQKLKLI
jgi:hypothetical protein